MTNGILISGKPYEMQAIDDATVRLISPKGEVYDVTQGPERVTCGCPDWAYRHADLPYSDGCKHVKALVQIGLMSNPRPTAHA